MKLLQQISKGIKYALILLFSLMVVSCNSWLDIKSEDRIMEGTLFSSKSGFMTALNGVYIDMMKNELYGAVLSYKLSDVLAQYYDCSNDEHPMRNLVKYDPLAKRTEVNGLWSSAYTLLVNINTIIEACDEQREVLDARYYHVFKGEALALRALIHFELFRVWGPIYSEDPEKECIPYASSSELVVRPLSKASEVVSWILEDLKDAEALLKEYDPIVEEGVLWSDAEAGVANDMRYRQMRMNYYAVKALIARVSLYVGDSQTALAYAEAVIKEAQTDHPWFPFVSRDAATEPQNPDRIYKSEVLFGLYNLRRATIWDNTFSNKLTNKIVYRPTSANIHALYEEENRLADWRYANQWITLKDPDGENLEYFAKYMPVKEAEDDADSQGRAYIMPVLKISEMYLIAAECTADKEKAYGYLDKLREARGVPAALRTYSVAELVEAEFRREFIGEGQLFWFYKRLNKKDIPSAADYNTPWAMEKSYYLFEIPQSEQDKRKQEN